MTQYFDTDRLYALVETSARKEGLDLDSREDRTKLIERLDLQSGGVLADMRAFKRCNIGVQDAVKLVEYLNKGHDATWVTMQEFVKDDKEQNL